MQQWIKDYGAACPSSQLNYQGIGSGGGIQQLIGRTVDFAGTDVPLSATERAAATPKVGAVVHVPWVAGSVAIEYHLRGVDDLQLSPATLAGLLAGGIQRWDDPRVQADNPGVELPAAPVQVVHRSDGSGTTAALTAYLQAAAPQEWRLGTGKEVKWPTGSGAKGSDGVTAQVKGSEGTIGYAELSYARGASLPVAKVRNAAGAYAGPEAAAVTAGLATAAVSADHVVQLDYSSRDPAAYPIAVVSYAAVPYALGASAKAPLLSTFIDFAINGGQSEAEPLGYAPLPPKVHDAAQAAVRSLMRPGDASAD